MEFEDLDNDNSINNIEPEITPILEDENIDEEYSENQSIDANDNSSKTENKPVDNLTNYSLNKNKVYENIPKDSKKYKWLNIILGIAVSIAVINVIIKILFYFAITLICGSMQ